MTPRERFVAAARAKIGSPYRWGGNGPDSFDCSGFICHCLRAAVEGTPVPDMSAAELARLLNTKRVEKKDALPGAIFFYGHERVHHVMACLHRWPDGHLILVGARGGNATTTDLEIAYRQGALIDITSGDYLSRDLAFVADPFQ